jgi:hypothetical protein
MKNYNKNIIYIRIYGGSLIPLDKVELVTTDPNNGKVLQEIPLSVPIEKLMHHNMNNFVQSPSNWNKLNSYDIVEKK